MKIYVRKIGKSFSLCKCLLYLNFFIFTFFIFIKLYALDKTITLMTPRRTFYTGRENVIPVRISGCEGKILSWNLQYNNTTIRAGEKRIPRSGIVRLKISMPGLKIPVAVTRLALAIKKEKIKLSQKLFFFSDNLFIGRIRFINELEIGILAPEADNPLADILKSYGIKSTPVDNLTSFTGKLLFIYKINLYDYSGIGEECNRLCLKGIKIIILNPTGLLPMNNLDADRILFAKNSIINEFDKKLDSDVWSEKKNINDKILKLVQYDEAMGIEIANKDVHNTFSFCEMRIGKGKLIITTWNIIENLQNSPTPLFLLKKFILD